MQVRDILDNKEELVELVKEAADAVFAAWIRLHEEEEKKKTGPLRVSREQREVINQAMEMIGCQKVFPGNDQTGEGNQSKAALLGADDGKTV